MTFEAKAEAKNQGGGLLSSFSTSRVGWWPAIPHYYGDVVRELLLGASALMLISSPWYANSISRELPFVLVGTLAAAAFAALTSPHARWTLRGDAIIAGVGAVAYAGWGIVEYDAINPIALLLRLVIATIFLFAFYFSMKTVRAFALGQIGKRETVDEFEEESERMEEEKLERETSGTRVRQHEQS